MVDALADATAAEIGQTEVAALVGLNTDLRREYISDCAGGVKRWNRILDEAGLPQRLKLPHVAFNRKVGAFARDRGLARRASCSPPTSGSGARASGCPPTWTRRTSAR